MARDYTALITSEHRSRPKFSAMVSLVSGAIGDTFDLIQSIPAAFDLDTAEGAQLDVIGLWVGQSRAIPGVLLTGFFGFDNDPAALPYGEEGNPSIGGPFYEEGDPTTGISILGDADYRLLLRAKIVRNHAKGETADIVRALSFLFDAPSSVSDPGIMAIGVAIGRPLSLTELALINLDILPRPSGVRIAWKGYYDADAYLGFDGQPNALPFAEEGDTTSKAVLLEEF